MLNISHTQTYGPITRSLEFDSGMSIGFSTRTFDSRLKPRPQGGGGQEPERGSAVKTGDFLSVGFRMSTFGFGLYCYVMRITLLQGRNCLRIF